jgi:2Fe-2S ferredoxin
LPTIIYVEHNGTEHQVEVPTGVSLMQGAVNAVVPGIDGDCGGLCACGTCHVHLRADAAGLCGEASDLESMMLEFAFGVDDDSRLACQVIVDERMDGMTVQMPERQY